MKNKLKIDTSKLALFQDVFEKPTSTLDFQTYPIFNEKYRNTLNHLIKEHFRYRKICYLEQDRFEQAFNCLLRELMPTYNRLFKSFEYMDGINVFDNIDITETRNANTTLKNQLKRLLSENGKELLTQDDKSSIINDETKTDITDVTNHTDNKNTQDETIRDNTDVTNHSEVVGNQKDTTHTETENDLKEETNQTNKNDSTVTTDNTKTLNNNHTDLTAEVPSNIQSESDIDNGMTYFSRAEKKKDSQSETDKGKTTTNSNDNIDATKTNTGTVKVDGTFNSDTDNTTDATSKTEFDRTGKLTNNSSIDETGKTTSDVTIKGKTEGTQTKASNKYNDNTLDENSTNSQTQDEVNRIRRKGREMYRSTFIEEFTMLVNGIQNIEVRLLNDLEPVFYQMLD